MNERESKTSRQTWQKAATKHETNGGNRVDSVVRCESQQYRNRECMACNVSGRSCVTHFTNVQPEANQRDSPSVVVKNPNDATIW